MGLSPPVERERQPVPAVAQCKCHTQVCPAPAEASPPQAGLLGPPQPAPRPGLCWSGPGVRSGAAPLPGVCRPGKLRHPLSWAWDSDRSLLASRPLAKALSLFLRKMQQESSLLLQSAKGPSRRGSDSQASARPGQLRPARPPSRADARRAARSGVPGSSCRSQDSAPGGVPAADRGPNQTGRPPRLPLPPRLPNTGFSPQWMSPPGLKSLKVTRTSTGCAPAPSARPPPAAPFPGATAHTASAPALPSPHLPSPIET